MFVKKHENFKKIHFPDLSFNYTNYFLIKKHINDRIKIKNPAKSGVLSVFKIYTYFTKIIFLVLVNKILPLSGLTAVNV